MEFSFEKIDSSTCPHLIAAFPGYTDGLLRVKPSNLLILPQYEDEHRNFKNLELRHDDLWVLSFPKSGTTWTQELVWLVASGLDYEGAKEFLRIRFPFVEEKAITTKSWWTAHQNAESSEHQVKCDDVVITPSRLAGLWSPRFLKSHLPLTCLPDNLLDTCKVVYVARNPKDVVVSWYFHHQLDPLMNTPLSLEQFVDLFINDEVLYSPYWNHVLEAWQRRNHPNMLFLFYEDLKEDLVGQIKKVADFLSRPVTAEETARLAEHLSFENFKSNPAVNGEELQAMGIFNKEGHFVRKGQSGGWRSHFSAEMNQRFDKWIQDNLKNTDLTFKNMS